MQAPAAARAPIPAPALPVPEILTASCGHPVNFAPRPDGRWTPERRAKRLRRPCNRCRKQLKREQLKLEAANREKKAARRAEEAARTAATPAKAG